MFRPDGEAFGINPKGFGPFISVRRFRYESTASFHPALVKIGEKLYMIPDWKEVLPETTINDITYIKPKPPKVKLEKSKFKFESKSDPGSFYTVTVTGDKVKCTCAGQYRAKDRNCVHMKTVKKKLGII